MTRVEEKDVTTITRTRHFWYVQLFCDVVFIFLAVFLSAVFPYHGEKTISGVPMYCLGEPNPEKYFAEVAEIFNPSLLIFVFGALFFAFPFAIVLNRIMLVAHSRPDQLKVPLSGVARFGRALFGWKGIVLLLILISVYLVLNLARPVYYRSAIFGSVPGLKSSQPGSVRMWTVLYLYNHPDPAAADSLYNTALHDNDSEVKVTAALNLGRLGDPRAVELLISTYEGNGWAERLIRKTLKNMDPCQVRKSLTEHLLGLWDDDYGTRRVQSFIKELLEECPPGGVMEKDKTGVNKDGQPFRGKNDSEN